MLNIARLKSLSSVLLRKLHNAVRYFSFVRTSVFQTPQTGLFRNGMPHTTKIGGNRSLALKTETKTSEVFFRRNDTHYIQNKVALVTGGAEGIGLRCVQELLKNGAKGVMIADRKEGGLQCVKEFAKEFGVRKVAFIKIDNSQELLRHAFVSTIHHFRGLDIVINNLKFQEEKRWTEQIDENIKGVVLNTLLAMEFMGRHYGRKGGTVVNIARCFDQRCDSCPLFQGVQEFVVGFDRSLAAENYPYSDVKVLTICQATLESIAIDLATVISKGRNGCVWTP